MGRTVVLDKANEGHRFLMEQILRLKKLKDVAKKANDDYEEKKLAVWDMAEWCMKENKADKVEFETEPEFGWSSHEKKGTTIAIKKVTKTNVEWFPEKVAEAIPEELSAGVIDKRYEVTSWQALVNAMKKYGVPANEVIPYIAVEKTVNVAALEQLNELGDVSQEDLEGCYKVNVKSSYLSMSETKTK